MCTRNLPPKSWMLGTDLLSQQTGNGETTEVLETCVSLPEEEESQLSLTAFKGELDSAVTQYLSQVKDLGYKEEGNKDQKLLAVNFKLNPDEITPKEGEEPEEEQPEAKVITSEDKGEQTELQVEVPSLDNPLYLTLSECSSGLLPHAEEDQLPLNHFYENCQPVSEDEHIYENVENSSCEDHLYDYLPRHKPDVPPKPDFLSQLAARQSEPVKRAWNPFVNLSVDTGDPTPPLSTTSSLSSPDSHISAENSGSNPVQVERKVTNPFCRSGPRETSEQTLILDGSETSDLGSSGGEDDVVSVEDWPLPPTPPSAEEEEIVEGAPLPPPPPELALQELEEKVIREEAEERKLALQKEKEAIEREYGVKDQTPEETEQVEAVNSNITSLEEKFRETSRKVQEVQQTETIKKPKIIEIDDDEDNEEFDTPAIRHSVIIELKDSCPTVPQSLKPSEIRRKESLKRSESLKQKGLVRRSESSSKFKKRQSVCDLFPVSSVTEPKKADSATVSVGVTSPKKEEPEFSFLSSCNRTPEQVIEISEDGSWEMKNTNMDSTNGNQDNKNADIDPFTGNPIMAPPLSPVAIPAPPAEFQTDDGMDGVYCANIVTTHSGPSSIASTATDSTATGDSVPPETPTLLNAPETIPEEPSAQEPLVQLDTKSQKTEDAGNEAQKDSNNDDSSSERGSPSHKNLGAAIMESYEHELQKKKDSMNLPEVSLLEFGDSVRDLEQQRRSVIKQMTVKAKRKDTWIKTYSMHSQGVEETIPVAPVRARRKNSPNRDQIQEGISDKCNISTSESLLTETATIDSSNSEANVYENIVHNTSVAKKNSSESIVNNNNSNNVNNTDSVVVPPKASRKTKGKKNPVGAEIPPIPVTKSENSQNPVEESIISPRNTAALAAFFSSPTKTAKDEKEPGSSPHNSPTKTSKKPSVEEVPENMEVVTDDNSNVEELVPVAKLSSESLVEMAEDSKVIEEEDVMVKEKNEINRVHNAMAKLESVEMTAVKEEGIKKEREETTEEKASKEEEVQPLLAPLATSRDEGDAPVSDASDSTLQPDEGEVEYFSILNNKSATKQYWESRMLATMDDGGWESVANVHFQPVPGVTPVIEQVRQEDSPGTVTPPPEFIPAPPPQFDNSPEESEESSPPSLDINLKETPNNKVDDTRPTKQYVYGITEAASKDKQNSRIVETVAKKPASQENVIEAEIRAQQMKEAELRQEGTLKTSLVREKGASSPASHDSDEGFVDRLTEDVTSTTTNGYTHAIPGNDGEPVIYDAVSPPPEYFTESTPASSSTTETKIALEIRELKEREEELRRMREQLMSSRENLLDDEEVRSSASRDQLLEDHLTSLTTTTDEGNFSECGDPASSEDKSSDGSNSRIMSPELVHPSSHLDFGRSRKVTVKPFEDHEEDQPVYTRMQKESVIEREIRLAREREEAYRREKGLLNSVGNSAIRSSTQNLAKPSVVASNDRRDVQHRMATSRIKLEIQETSMKEKELRDAGKILTMSEDTVDAKVTRLSDFTEQSQSESPRNRPTSSRPSNFITPPYTPKRSQSPLSPSSPVPNFTPSPAYSRGLTKSLSTTNLASPTSSTAMRAPKGLMQKFIASRGKMTAPAFASPPPTYTHTTSHGVPTRPMRVEPKAAIIQRETIARMKPGNFIDSQEISQPTQTSSQQQYRRTYCTAEEKIQSELKEMQMREEELRRLRARQLAQSQPNLMDMGIDEDEPDEEMITNNNYTQEMNGLRTTLSNPNLLDDEPDHPQEAVDKGVRRRSALIAQWENRIQQTTDT